LDWLDLSETDGSSYQDVTVRIADSASAINGWRYATTGEFFDLLHNYTDGVGNDITPSEVEYPRHMLRGLIGYLGDSAEAYSRAVFGKSTNDAYGWSGINEASVGMLAEGLGMVPTAQIANLEQLSLYTATTTFDRNIYVADPGTTGISSYLVRGSFIPTPLPAGIFLFAPALLGFFGLRRKLKA